MSVEEIVYKRCWTILGLKKAITPNPEENISAAKQVNSKLIVDINY